MTSSIDPKFFQILPTRALSSGPAQKAEPTRAKSRSLKTSIPGKVASSAWEVLKERIRALRQDASNSRIDALSASLQGTMEQMLAENWQRAQHVIADAAGDALAIAIIGSLSESPTVVRHLMTEIDDATLSDELRRREEGAEIFQAPAATSSRTMLATLSSQKITRIEPALDEIERQPRHQPTPLGYDCTATVKALVRERCASLVPPVRMKIEKELSFELSATSEVTFTPPADPVTLPKASDDNIEAMKHALSDNDVDAAVEALSRLPGCTPELTREAINGRNARAITSLGWKLGLPASLTSAVQIHLALIPPARAILPREDGDYALTPREMNWQLDFLRDKCAAVAA
ncbi:hypothetical protein [Acetobacter oeni]|uniref:Uncharacterized protein n=1 Tax=Acetobacter oeni TaxID=304077 RepID=A0A511XM43_9PROT|nr:hypothetical protein [Acetobacter oeni]MBB3884032.1 hypothetical protein [Acetobacter oeni]NHO20021.1 hypothetical protein [Acetobacter oeni]GBR04569.1 hypothetical protein AA21952_1470 [Acetobacter oeni LMG 21952]GEN64019.1 hypothetical protein AOE01nite_22430 [Acetobacter oeni]